MRKVLRNTVLKIKRDNGPGNLKGWTVRVSRCATMTQISVRGDHSPAHRRAGGMKSVKTSPSTKNGLKHSITRNTTREGGKNARFKAKMCMAGERKKME